MARARSVAARQIRRRYVIVGGLTLTLGALIAALPLVTILALIWLHVETGSHDKVANHAWYTFWYVVPTLPMFLTFPFLLGRIGFWPTMLASAAITVASFWLFTFVARSFGVELMP